MPDPNTHADDMKSPAEYTPPTIKDALPPMWWFCPWPVVTALVDAVDHLKSTSRGEQAARIAANVDRMKSDEEVAALLVKCDDYARALSKANEKVATLNKWNDQLIAATNAAKDEADTLARKLGEARAEIEHANSDLTELQRRHVDVKIARDAAVDAVAELNDKLHREQVDHAATLGYVKMAEASLKRWKALAKARGNRLPAKKKKGVSK